MLGASWGSKAHTKSTHQAHKALPVPIGCPSGAHLVPIGCPRSAPAAGRDRPRSAARRRTPLRPRPRRRAWLRGTSQGRLSRCARLARARVGIGVGVGVGVRVRVRVWVGRVAVPAVEPADGAGGAAAQHGAALHRAAQRLDQSRAPPPLDGEERVAAAHQHRVRRPERALHFFLWRRCSRDVEHLHVHSALHEGLAPGWSSAVLSATGGHTAEVGPQAHLGIQTARLSLLLGTVGACKLAGLWRGRWTRGHYDHAVAHCLVRNLSRS